MKMVKSLLLGSAAGVVAMAGAQAADLPVKAKPVQYVKICSLYGAGFYYIPGTDTCLKIGGFVRAEMNFNAGNSFTVQTGDHSSRTFNFEQSRARFGSSFDSRTQTEYGTLRTYMNLAMQASNGTGGSGIGTWANRGFIQWAGFTFGLADSFFDFWGNSKYSNSVPWWSSDKGGVGDIVFAYTAQFGNGFSATVSAEDTSARRTGIYAAGSTYAGRQWPDFVGNLRVDQAWGSAQIMGAVHQVRAVSYGDKVGWAVGGGLKLNLPWSKGDNLTVQAGYTQGALSYVGQGIGTFTVSNNGTSIAYANSYDAVGNGTGLELTKGWSVIAGAEHHWNSMWKTSLYGSYGEIDYNSTATGILNGATGNPDWNYSRVGSRTVWTPVKGLAFSVDMLYSHVGTATAQTTADHLNASDVGWFQGMFRVQRNY